MAVHILTMAVRIMDGSGSDLNSSDAMDEIIIITK